MIGLLGKNYYIDVDKVIEKCRPNYPTAKPRKKRGSDEDDDRIGLELNIFKFEIFKACIERVLAEYNEKEDDIPVFQEKSTTLSFRLAFNTLLKYDILIEDVDG
jgi:hypothetical protein